MLNIGALIRQKRKERGMSQVALAGASGVCLGNVKRIEKAPCPVTTTTLEALAKALRCNVADLVATPRRKSA